MSNSSLSQKDGPQLFLLDPSSDTEYLDRQYGRLEFFPGHEDASTYPNPPTFQMPTSNLGNTQYYESNRHIGQKIGQWGNYHHDQPSGSTQLGSGTSEDLDCVTNSINGNEPEEQDEEGVEDEHTSINADRSSEDSESDHEHDSDGRDFYEDRQLYLEGDDLIIGMFNVHSITLLLFSSNMQMNNHQTKMNDRRLMLCTTL